MRGQHDRVERDGREKCERERDRGRQPDRHVTATRSATAVPTTPLQLVLPNGTPKSGVPLVLPAAALALLAWAGLRRRG